MVFVRVFRYTVLVMLLLNCWSSTVEVVQAPGGGVKVLVCLCLCFLGSGAGVGAGTAFGAGAADLHILNNPSVSNRLLHFSNFYLHERCRQANLEDGEKLHVDGFG